MSKKKMALIAVGALVVALALPTAAFATGSYFGMTTNFAACQGGQLGSLVQSIHHRVDNQCDRFADADDNGVCDNYGTHRDATQSYGFGNGNGTCPGFVDTDSNGECDNYREGACDGADHRSDQGNDSSQGLGNGQGSDSGRGSGSNLGSGNNQGSDSAQDSDDSWGHGRHTGRGAGAHGGHGSGCLR